MFRRMMRSKRGSLPPKEKGLTCMTLRSRFQSCFVEFRSAYSEEKSKMPHPIRGQGGHLVFRST